MRPKGSAEVLEARRNRALRLLDEEGAHLVFVDESGFLLIPNVRRTWAPRGHTPLLRHRQRRDRISIISGLSVSARADDATATSCSRARTFDTLRSAPSCGICSDTFAAL